MARYTGPVTRINRRFGQALFPSNRAFENKPYPPGQHGPRLRRKKSDYALGLDEKQKLRFLFGLTEKQFRITFAKAKSKRGVTGEIFLQLLESRLDSVVYTMGLAGPAARPVNSSTTATFWSMAGRSIFPAFRSVPGTRFPFARRPPPAPWPPRTSPTASSAPSPSG